MECNYTKIVNGYYCPVCGSETKTYGFFEGRSWIQEKKKYKKKQKDVGKPSKCGFLFCDKCGGYYELQEGESSDDFDLECECGGKIHFTKTIEDDIGEKALVDLPYCPFCGAKKPKGKFCETCGAILNGTESDDSFKSSFLIEGLSSNAKISIKSIIIHKKLKKVTGGVNVEEYPINLIEKVKLSESITGYDLNFKYEGEYVKLDVPTNSDNPTIEAVEEFFKDLTIPVIKNTLDRPASVKKYGICPNISCLNDDTMEVDSKCPDCGSIVKKAGFSERMKIMGGKDKLRREIKETAKFKQDRVKIEQKWIEYADEKKRYVDDKKRKYGCLKVARGKSGRLELYDNRIKLYYYGEWAGSSSQNQVYLIEDIIAIDFREANRHGGSINFNIRGLNPTPSRRGGMLLYGPRTGFTFGLGSTGGSEPPKTGIFFKGEWEPEFREIKDIVEAKLQESHGKLLNENKKLELDDLEKLAELRDKGIITEEEFETKKKQVLDI